VAAVEDRAIQVAFRRPAGIVVVRAGPRRLCIDHPGGPAVVAIEGLAPATAYTVEVGDAAGRGSVRARTLPSPPGLPLARLATISDLHLGSTRHGLAGTMFDRSRHAEPAALRCARGAIIESAAWGAQLLVGKGDLTQHGWVQEWEQLGRLLDRHAPGITRLATPGNHDLPSVREVDAAHGLRLAGLPCSPVGHVDLDGVRVIAMDSSLEGRGMGSLRRHGEAAVELAADAARGGRAALVCLHHPLERAPVQLQYPKGVAWAEGRAFARRLGRANRRTLLTAGHTHRNRRRMVGPVVHTEVGSTKDWPGVWAGYVVHEGGIRQVVRRIAAPDAIGWIDYSRWAAAGLWWPYSPGRLSDRCFTLSW
jgi:hypothetical protein